MKEFMLSDKLSGIEKKAIARIKFNYENNDYLIYTIDENEDNVQIFVSKLTVNSEGKIFIDNISLEEKNKLNGIVYNIVVKLPVEVKKGVDPKTLINSLGVKLSVPDSISEKQEYYRDCSFAITSKLAINGAEEFVKSTSVNEVKEESAVPTWNIPSIGYPNPVNESTINNEVPITMAPSAPTSDAPAVAPEPENVVTPLVSTPNDFVIPVNTNVDTNNDVNVVPMPFENKEPLNNVENVNVVDEPNPQLAVLNDPSVMNINPNLQKNNGKPEMLKKAGFANSKYVIIGTVCIVLAIAVAVVAYILISNMK